MEILWRYLYNWFILEKKILAYQTLPVLGSPSSDQVCGVLLCSLQPGVGLRAALDAGGKVWPFQDLFI